MICKVDRPEEQFDGNRYGDCFCLFVRRVFIFEKYLTGLHYV